MELTAEQKIENAKKLIEIGKAIAQARIDFGLSNNQSDPNADVQTAKSIVEGIILVRRGFLHSDVLEAIRLFGKGIIRFENQLSVVSVQNIVRSYEFYVTTYKPKHHEPAFAKVAPVSHQLGSGNDLKNKLARREMFVKYLSGELSGNKMGFDFSGWFVKVYDQMVQMAVIDTDLFIPKFRVLLVTMLNDETQIPSFIRLARDKRNGVKLIRQWLENNMDGEKMVLYPFEKFENMDFHKYLVNRVKKDLIAEARKLGNQKLIEIYDQTFGHVSNQGNQ